MSPGVTGWRQPTRGVPVLGPGSGDESHRYPTGLFPGTFILNRNPERFWHCNRDLRNTNLSDQGWRGSLRIETLLTFNIWVTRSLELFYDRSIQCLLYLHDLSVYWVGSSESVLRCPSTKVWFKGLRTGSFRNRRQFVETLYFWVFQWSKPGVPFPSQSIPNISFEGFHQNDHFELRCFPPSQGKSFQFQDNRPLLGVCDWVSRLNWVILSEGRSTF